jgi:hypothetical protein
MLDAIGACCLVGLIVYTAIWIIYKEAYKL